MPIKQFELFHGAVLTRLMRNKRPMTLRLIETNVNDLWAVYVINDVFAILIKYSANPQSGKGSARFWQFTFPETQLTQLREPGMHIALVCGAENLSDKKMEICLVEAEDMTKLIDLDAKTRQWMRVDIQENKQPVVTGTLNSKGSGIKIPRKRLEQLKVPGS
jgi:hypothetical protein